MWKFSSKKDRENDVSPKAASRLGARKVALFLSVLEPSVAERLLSLLDSRIAFAIAEEAKTISVVSPKDIEKTVSDFLDAVGRDSLGSELTNALVAEACCDLCSRARSQDNSWSEREQSFLSLLGSITPERLSSLLENERLSTLAAIVSKLSSPDKDVLLGTFPADAKELVLRFGTRSCATPSLRRLEDVLFERS